MWAYVGATGSPAAQEASHTSSHKPDAPAPPPVTDSQTTASQVMCYTEKREALQHLELNATKQPTNNTATLTPSPSTHDPHTNRYLFCINKQDTGTVKCGLAHVRLPKQAVRAPPHAAPTQVQVCRCAGVQVCCDGTYRIAYNRFRGGPCYRSLWDDARLSYRGSFCRRVYSSGSWGMVLARPKW